MPNSKWPAAGAEFFLSSCEFFRSTRSPRKKFDVTKNLIRKRPFLRTAKKSSVPWLGGCGCCGWVVVAAVAGWLWPLWLGGCGRCGWVVVAAVAGWWWLLWLGGCGCCGCCGCCEVEHGREPENAKLVCRGSFVYFLVSKQTRTCHNVAKVVGAVGAGGAGDVVGACVLSAVCGSCGSCCAK